MDKDSEVLTFPDVFPYGSGGYEVSQPHEIKLTLCKYFQQRLMNVDGSLQETLSICFVHSMQQIMADSNFALRLTKGKTLSGDKVTAGMLRTLELISKLVQSEQAYKFFKMLEDLQHIDNVSCMRYWLIGMK